MQDAAPASIETTELILPAQANHYGTLFAGNALSMMANAAYAAASRQARGNVVLASVDGLRFTAPVPVGSLLNLSARIARSGRSSMQVEVTGHCETPGAEDRRQIAQGQFTMVAVGKTGRPKKITVEGETR
ncbi:MAG: acyl-CoA thioesterase [Paracoccus sp. (in: a-proteobacteria)]